MKTFKIYLKDGKVISLDFLRFQIIEHKLQIQDSSGLVAEDVFIPLESVSTIVLADQQKRENEQSFNLYLKKHDEAIEVVAVTFQFDDAGKLEFKRRSVYETLQSVREIYVDASEVLAIVPNYSLERW
jgi:hypothetical protein